MQAGDKVFVTNGIWVKLTTVVRTTKTQIILPHDQRFRRETLRRVGSSGFRQERLKEWTPEAEETFRASLLTAKINTTIRSEEFLTKLLNMGEEYKKRVIKDVDGEITWI